MTNNYFKRRSTSQVIRERQIKTTVRYCLTPLEWLSSRNLIADVGERLENRNPYSVLVDMQIDTAIKETNLTPQFFFKKNVTHLFTPVHMLREVHTLSWRYVHIHV